MSNQEILEKAIQKAIAGGWNWKPFTGWDEKWQEPSDTTKVGQVMAEFYDENVFMFDKLRTLLFNHDFAKALWGDTTTKQLPSDKVTMTATGLTYTRSAREVRYKSVAWKRHLQQMVVANDPIKYLGDNI